MEASGALINSHEFEREVIEYFAPFFGFKKKENTGVLLPIAGQTVICTVCILA